MTDIEKVNQVPQYFNTAREFMPGASMHECTPELQPPIQVPENTSGDLKNEVTTTNNACASIDIAPLITHNDDVDLSELNISSDVTQNLGKEDYMPSPVPLQIDGPTDLQINVLAYDKADMNVALHGRS